MPDIEGVFLFIKDRDFRLEQPVAPLSNPAFWNWWPTFLLKKNHYATENFLHFQDCTKRLFGGMGSTKQPKKGPLHPLIIFPLSFYQFSHTLFGETPILFGKTLYNLAKLSTFAKLYRVLPDCTGVLPKSIHHSPIAMLSAVSKRPKKRSPPPTMMNLTKPEIPNRKPRFRFFQAISIYFCQIVQNSYGINY